ncbi:hypothetical protein PROFUN_10950 [Planoprotostelium fungivorum]|uniref:Uncharacterized protein n=1 Tax=Planoprotostelium fungivorum TaxID=1890364 RepID=A0A2P6NBU6_9EUKA|nr:hypothetical protein PROFUN_10950 [Planoprotostelium fungivorum]
MSISQGQSKISSCGTTASDKPPFKEPTYITAEPGKHGLSNTLGDLCSTGIPRPLKGEDGYDITDLATAQHMGKNYDQLAELAQEKDEEEEKENQDRLKKAMGQITEKMTDVLKYTLGYSNGDNLNLDELEASDTGPLTEEDTEYPLIQELGIIGNLKTCAIIDTHGEIVQFCYPAFDSPTIFGKILDKDKGGSWAVRPICKTPEGYRPFRDTRAKQFYYHHTNHLITRLRCQEGLAQTTDYMPVGVDPHNGHDWLMREVEVINGEVSLEVVVRPAFNYARSEHSVEMLGHGVLFHCPDLKLSMALTANRKYRWALSGDGKAAYCRFRLFAGQKVSFVLREVKKEKNEKEEKEKREDTVNKIASVGKRNVKDLVKEGSNSEDLEDGAIDIDYTGHICKLTVDYWRNWISMCKYTGRYMEAVHRSALTLKLLTYEPTGAVVAAATTSLPEQMGDTLNYDYRYAWIRDSSFVLYAFIILGFRSEARAFLRWVEKRCDDATEGGKYRGLQIMYGIRGEKELEEIELTHLDGYRGSKPVRIGNAAYKQFQLDIFGELMETITLADFHAEPISYDFWCKIRIIIDWLTEHWTKVDGGVWEFRDKQKHYTYSKVMAWVAMDRAITLAEARNFPADLIQWKKVKGEIFVEVMDRGWNNELQCFTQCYDCTTLDASVLMIPLVNMLSPNDPRMLSTLERISRSVTRGGLTRGPMVYRFSGSYPDEGAFFMCSLWLMNCAVRAGAYDHEMLEKGRHMFERLLGWGNHCGLYSEEVEINGDFLGNFPQAFTNLALIAGAITLDMTLNKG